MCLPEDRIWIQGVECKRLNCQFRRNDASGTCTGCWAPQTCKGDCGRSFRDESVYRSMERPDVCEDCWDDPCVRCKMDNGLRCLMGTHVCTIQPGNRPCEISEDGIDLTCDDCKMSTVFPCYVGRC